MSDIVDNSLEHAGKFRSRKTGEYCKEDDPYAIPADEYQTYLDKYDNVTDSVAALNVMSKVTKDVSTDVAKAIPDKKGSKKYSEHPELSDDEIRRRVNRMMLDRQYSDLTGETKYVKSGEEKCREALQTIGAIAGIGLTITSIIVAIRQNRRPSGGKPSNG